MFVSYLIFFISTVRWTSTIFVGLYYKNVQFCKLMDAWKSAQLHVEYLIKTKLKIFRSTILDMSLELLIFMKLYQKLVLLVLVLHVACVVCDIFFLLFI